MVTIPKKKVLLAEDDASMRRFIEIILRQADYEVLTAEDGLAAMKIVLESEIDAVVTDAIMPNLSGFDLCRMIRGNNEKNKIPIIILSGLADQNSDTSAQLANAFLVKDTNLKKKLIQTLRIMTLENGML